MTPLSGTKNPSAPVGDKSGGDRKAARSLLSCALWRGMGRLWRGMGGMGRPEPLPAHRPHQQEGLSDFHGSRDTNHELFAVLFDVGAHGSHRQEPSPGHGFPVHDCSPLFMIVRHCSAKKYYPRASGPSPSTPATRPERFLRITAFVLARLWRGMGGILPPRRSPPLPTPSGLVPPRRTPNEPMPRQTNVLDCPNESTLYMTMTPDRTAPGTVPLNRYNRLAWTSHHEARHGAAVRGKTVRTRSGSSGALLPCPLLAVTGNRPAMPGGPVACYGVSPGDDQALGMTACTMRRRPQ